MWTGTHCDVWRPRYGGHQCVRALSLELTEIAITLGSGEAVSSPSSNLGFAKRSACSVARLPSVAKRLCGYGNVPWVPWMVWVSHKDVAWDPYWGGAFCFTSALFLLLRQPQNRRSACRLGECVPNSVEQHGCCACSRIQNDTFPPLLVCK